MTEQLFDQYDRSMTATRMTISVDRNLAKAAKKSAGKQPLSAWIADAMAAKLRNDGWSRLIADWEIEHGKITDDDLRKAEREIELARRRKW